MKAVRLADLPTREPLDASEALGRKELSWERILEEEPEIGRVFDELSRGGKDGRRRWFAFYEVHGTTPKAYLCKLVGWDARNPRLRSPDSYRMVIERMWELLS